MKKEQHDTAQRVLEAATRIFAELGFAGARVDEIAKAAGMNKTAIYYHIGGKEELYSAVLHKLLSKVVERTLEKIQEAGSPEEKLKAYIHGIAQTIGQNPYAAQIMLRESASGIQHASELVTDTFLRLAGTLKEILDEGHKQGDFIKVEPIIIELMIMGSVAMLKAKTSFMSDYHREKLLLLTTLDPADEHLFHSVALEVERLILRAVKKKRGGCES